MKAIACELPATLGLPLSRVSRAEWRRHVLAAALVAEISGMTIWHWLRADAIRPWTHRSWIVPRDPDFAKKAGPVLDLYHRCWKGKALGPRDFVLSADEKTQIPIRSRRHPITPPAPGHAPYRTARRVFWVVDNGTVHRGQWAIDRLQARWPNRILDFQAHYQTVARPFDWRFTRRDLARLLARCAPAAHRAKLAA